jgi:pimeloyl-ACP methyl ester carboxylesterase
MADRETIGRLLGPDWHEARLQLMADEPGAGRLRRLTFLNHKAEAVPALWLPPREGPTVLYCHAHGGRYHIGMAELTEGRPALRGPWLPEFAARGWGVLCLEMPCFGARAAPGEGPRAKAHLWHGRTLFGQMLGEQRAGLDWMLAEPGVDPARVAVMGISMGGTLAWWLAAMDPRLAAAVSMCCFADLARLIETGAHDRHGIYMTVPGLLAATSTGLLSGLAAPTPLLHCVGFGDWSTPEDAFRIAEAELLWAYRAAGATPPRFHEAEAPGHEETEAMRAVVCAFLEETLAPVHAEGRTC